jgi:uncharacterized membrane protein
VTHPLAVASLIAPGETWTIWAVILLGAALSIYLEQTYRWAARISGAVLVMLGGMLLSNLKILPIQSPVYDTVNDYLVPVALPLLLFRANALQIVRSTGRMFLAFHVATVGTVLGAFAAALLLSHVVPSTPEAAGIMTASYVGGAVNFFAVKESFGVSADLTGPLIVADSVIMTAGFGLLLILPGLKFFRRHYPHPHTQDADLDQNRLLAAEYWKRKEISLLDIAKALAVAVTIATVAHQCAALIRDNGPPTPLTQSVAGNPYVWITELSLLAATFFPNFLGKIGGAEELGAYLLFVFFFVIGVPANLSAVIWNSPALFGLCLVMAGMNIGFTLVVGKLLRMDLEDLLLSCNATLGGPANAAAMAIAKGWPKLVLPGVLVGIWGYVIGTFLGVLVVTALRQLLG